MNLLFFVQSSISHVESPFFLYQARERDASAYEKRIGAEMSEMLRELIAPHFLRRTKAMVLENRKTCDNTDSAPSVTASTKVER